MIAIFVAAFVPTAIYLLLIWRLIIRWNALSLGPRLTFRETPAVLRVIWGRAPAKHDGTFLQLRGAARIAFGFSLTGIFALFGFVFLAVSR